MIIYLIEINRKEQMFGNPIDFLWQMPYDEIKEFRECSCWERRDYII
nr:MAG TPA: hypothetical protein [Caudoviricetes sp.]